MKRKELPSKPTEQVQQQEKILPKANTTKGSTLGDKEMIWLKVTWLFNLSSLRVNFFHYLLSSIVGTPHCCLLLHLLDSLFDKLLWVNLFILCYFHEQELLIEQLYIGEVRLNAIELWTIRQVEQDIYFLLSVKLHHIHWAMHSHVIHKQQHSLVLVDVHKLLQKPLELSLWNSSWIYKIMFKSILLTNGSYHCLSLNCDKLWVYFYILEFSWPGSAWEGLIREDAFIYINDFDWEVFSMLYSLIDLNELIMVLWQSIIHFSFSLFDYFKSDLILKIKPSQACHRYLCFWELPMEHDASLL